MKLDELHRLVHEACHRLDLDKRQLELETLRSRSTAEDFWQDTQSATAVMQQIGELEARITPWLELRRSVDELADLAAMNDASLNDDLATQTAELTTKYVASSRELRYNEPYDNHAVLLSIHAGAGGTDAQDWAQMLLRMYTRWAEAERMSVAVLDESSGEEAGIKRVDLEIKGAHAYGKLKGENGVHRLVRLSPFNSDAKRQTSFAKVDVLPKIDQPEVVPIDESDLKIDVFRSGGKGGQSVNTTDSAVRITHVPTNIVVSIQNERSQLQNRETALTILRSKLAQLQLEQHAEHISELKGPNEQAAWGNQIRSYVLHPYTMVKDLRTRYETTNAQAVLDGDLNPFIEAYSHSNTKHVLFE